MKTFLVIIALLCLHFTSQAQLRYYDQWAPGINAGITSKKGYFASAGIEKYFNRKLGSIALHLNYMRNSQFFLIKDFNITTITISTSYFHSLERVVKPPFFINVGAGIFAGSESFEKEKKLPEGIVQNADTRFVYGITFKPQAEYLFSKKVSLLFQPQADYYIESKYSSFVFILSLGLKIYL